MDRINASTNIAHILAYLFAASHEDLENANGASTIATSSRALRRRRGSQTIASATIASPARKMTRIAPTPGEAIVMLVRPATSAAI
ncbi:hypothetical protein [Bifidobacterium psychraerophilum]|uniref:hypothetical protein n=1 Tax=Bifidobacterium psychraerophilum TaxID=218140 RepID=UPI000529968C|nr:hypothetical protein [Bifidobacterium psychraerophilum]